MARRRIKPGFHYVVRLSPLPTGETVCSTCGRPARSVHRNGRRALLHSPTVVRWDTRPGGMTA